MNERTAIKEFIEKFGPTEKKELEEAYKEQLIPELIIALLEGDDKEAAEISEATNTPQSLIQEFRSLKRENITLDTLIRIGNAFGYSLLFEKIIKPGVTNKIRLTEMLEDDLA
jgi:hypothetical protein